MIKWRWLGEDFMQTLSDHKTWGGDGAIVFITTAFMMAIGVLFPGIFLGTLVDGTGPLSTLGALLTFAGGPLLVLAGSQFGRLSVYRRLDNDSKRAVERYYKLSKDDRKRLPDNLVTLLKSDLDSTDRDTLQHKAVETMRAIETRNQHRENVRKKMEHQNKQKVYIDSALQALDDETNGVRSETEIYTAELLRLENGR